MDDNTIAVTPVENSNGPSGLIAESIRTFRIATWLGWQVESNWADPIIFVIFSILRPLATALIILVMYTVVAGGIKTNFFDYLYTSNALFVLVLQTLSGLTWTIFDDRENYKMLKYIYTSPARRAAYYMGRAVAKVSIGLFTTTFLLVLGALFMGLHVSFSTIQWGWLLLYFVLGETILVALGLSLAGIALIVTRNGAFIGEVFANLMLLVCSAYFPPDVLPGVLQKISLSIPVTYWLEGMRRALIGGVLTIKTSGVESPVSPLLARYTNSELAMILLVAAVVIGIACGFFIRWIQKEAQERGMIDRLTGY